MLQGRPGDAPRGTSGGQREDRHPVAAAVLGGVHGRVGVERQRGLVGAVVGVQRDTDAGRDLDPQAGQVLVTKPPYLKSVEPAALLTDNPAIQEVLLFPQMRPEKFE